MGPHSTECGNNHKDYATGRYMLQWGRTQLSAEIAALVERLGDDDALQWGRTQLSAEIL